MNPAQVHRRRFLKSLGQASAAALAMDHAPLLRGSEPDPPRATADCLVLLWMAGGMAHTETFDPKRYVPFEPGIESRRVLSTFPAIDTSVDGIKFTAGLEEMASVMDEGALIRTFTLPIVDKIVHSRHQYHWHTGYLPPLTVAAPHIGSVIARTLGPKNPDVPAFIDIGETFAEAEREASVIRSFLSAGFLGAEYGPFLVPHATEAARRFESVAGPRRSESREKAFQAMVAASPVSELASSYQQQSMLRSMEQAYGLMKSPVAKVFEMSDEPKRSMEYYGAGPFGQGCLLARRLVEAGARFIEVHIPYKPFGYWDTHENGHSATIKLKQMIDPPVARLIRDLRERGLLDRTLVVLASEFSRDVLIEGKEAKRARVGRAAIVPVMSDERHYGMHAHFAEAGSILLWGGGVKKGVTYGETADEHPCKAISKPVGIEDVHATLYHAMGISPRQAYDVERRPFYVTRDGVGKPIFDLVT
ncbi:MAG: DUF1501 domain-containing protein [Pirellulales bacterium]|nr:DUF1501 domain-containing protein [Pirellulales bacterium]